ncbi:type VII toxin-antitoxin system MntA family adenylyltransferase antitoxin [Fuchsiella alkaliacetigena]|uniref:type VII toxin-antitoxin system MntA family adenylyltransferase antitoxin n=1 Tax=Fuchsiella alkaliacetigena TaxID=957042 RepID=UPI00200B5583|nr:nucleotidyltransferase domain-containing protein [Fuchsiella alkaliacetigena]MCK8825742.1 nucleotidyltransferase domain-containing protein [Fuchsiella alkaliacetigena]
MLNKAEIKRVIKEYCLQNKNIIAVYIFGSFIRGTFNQNSDIDLALMLKAELDKMAAFDLKLKVATELEELLGIEVDTVIFSRADLRLKQQIIKGELIIGKKNKLRVRRESRVVDDYLDMKYFYDLYEQNLGKGFRNG